LPAGTDRHRPNLDANTSDTIANAGPIWPVFSIRRDWKISMNTDSAAVSSIPPPQFPVPHRRSFPKESEHWQRRGRQRPRITTASSCARCRLGGSIGFETVPSGREKNTSLERREVSSSRESRSQPCACGARNSAASAALHGQLENRAGNDALLRCGGPLSRRSNTAASGGCVSRFAASMSPLVIFPREPTGP
jgi:hypothetical protein